MANIVKAKFDLMTSCGRGGGGGSTFYL
jgi:hypothetical protein